MARITPPFNTGVPGFNFNGLQINVPVDLPEGGHLCVIVGESPAGIPVPSIAIPKGAMIGVIGPEIAQHLRPHVNAALEEAERLRKQQANGG